jgi:transposase
MSKNGIRYSEEFKQQIIALYQSGSSVSYLSSEYGVAKVTIYKWLKEASPIKYLRRKKSLQKNTKK